MRNKKKKGKGVSRGVGGDMITKNKLGVTDLATLSATKGSLVPIQRSLAFKKKCFICVLTKHQCSTKTYFA